MSINEYMLYGVIPSRIKSVSSHEQEGIGGESLSFIIDTPSGRSDGKNVPPEKVVAPEGDLCLSHEHPFDYLNFTGDWTIPMLSDRLKSKGVKTIYVDLFPITSQEEFIKLYFLSVVSSLESRTDRVMRLLKEILNFKPSFSINVDREGNTTFSLHVEKGEEDRTFEEVVNLPFVYARKTNKKLCVVFDEFQEVYRLGLSAKLRSVIQKHSREVSYIFSGSRKSILEKMFSDRREPFYRSVKKLSLEPISEEDWVPFIKGKFEETRKRISDTFIRRGIKLLEGHPYAVQQLFHFVWEETGKSVDEEIFERAVDILIESEKDTFWYLWEDLTSIQRKVLKLITHTDGKELYKRENLERFSLSANLVQKSIKSLIEKDVLDKKNGRIVFQNPLMKLWLISLLSN